MKDQLRTNETYGTYTDINDDHSTINKESILEQDIKQNYTKYNIAMFLCGLINNTGYVLVATAAQSIATHFKMESFMSAFNLQDQSILSSLIFMSIGMVFMNAKLFIKIKHKKRVYVAIILSAFSFIIIGICTTIDQKYAFYVSLIGATLCGCMQSFGEATMLGYCKCFSSSLIGLWSSGTGFAGIFGSGFFLVLRAMKFTDFWIFVSAIPFLLIYLVSFQWLDYKRIHLSGNQVKPIENQEVEDESTNNLQMTFENMKYVLRLAWTYSLNLGAVYFFEYFILTCWADRANPGIENGNYFEKNAYAILAFSYQVGVFLSRSSLQFVKIQRVTILTIIQGCNCGIWALIALLYYYKDQRVMIGLQISLMLWVGLMGGGSYVNVNYLVVSGTFLPQNCKELCMNINSMVNNIGIMFATILAMIVSNFWIKE